MREPLYQLISAARCHFPFAVDRANAVAQFPVLVRASLRCPRTNEMLRATRWFIALPDEANDVLRSTCGTQRLATDGSFPEQTSLYPFAASLLPCWAADAAVLQTRIAMIVTNIACMHAVERAHHQTYQNHVVWEQLGALAGGGLGYVVRLVDNISIGIGISITTNSLLDLAQTIMQPGVLCVCWRCTAAGVRLRDWQYQHHEKESVKEQE